MRFFADFSREVPVCDCRVDSDWLGVGFGYEGLKCVVRVQSVTWAAVVGCPCGWCWLVLVGWGCSPVSPCRPVVSRLRGNDGPVTMTGGQGGLVVYVVYGQVMVL